MDTMMKQMSGPFMGPEVKRGRVAGMRTENGLELAFSPDFVIPDAPAPHWQVVDMMGNVHLLQRLKVAGDRENRTIRVPSFVQGVVTVRIWCAFAEAVLGETTFDTPVM